MITHIPLGSGHPYSPDTDQRFPIHPVAGETLTLGVRASADIAHVELELDIDGERSSFSLSPVARSTRGQISDGGHLASAQAKKNRRCGGWRTSITLPSAGKNLRYRFMGSKNAGTKHFESNGAAHSESKSSACSHTRWFNASISHWIPASQDLLDIPDTIAVSNIEVLADSATIHRIRFSLPLAANEHVCGFGERYDGLDQRGQELDSVVFEQYKNQGLHRRTYMPMPFAHVVGGQGWGFWVQTTSRVWFSVGVANPGELRIEAEVNAPLRKELNVLLANETNAPLSTSSAHAPLHMSKPILTVSIYRGSPRHVLHSFLDAVGHPRELPESVFGLWASGNEWNTQAEVMRQARLHRHYDIPISNLVIEAWSDESTFTIFRDAQYEIRSDGSAHHLKDFTFPADGAWPNPKEMVDDLHEQGICVYLWQIPLLKMRPHPTGQAAADARYAIDHHLVIERLSASGRRIPYRNRGWWFPLALMPDLSHPETIRWWAAKRRYLVEELGIDGFKTDGGEHAWGYDLVYQDGARGADRNNTFPVYYAQTYGDLLEACGKAPLTFSRSGYTGSQAHGAFWAGDENSTWEAFRWSMIAGLSAAACGIFYWGWDIAGFSGPLPSPELYVRAMAASAFIPIMQYHSEFNHHKLPSRDRTPWNMAEHYQDPSIISDVRKIVQLRVRLIPYLKAQAKKSIATSSPLMRPLFFEHPNDPQIWDRIQWYVGDDVLVAPVLEEGASSWEVYLPQGEWIHAHTGVSQPGKTLVTVDVSQRTSIPIFVRAEAWPELASIFLG